MPSCLRIGSASTCAWRAPKSVSTCCPDRRSCCDRPGRSGRPLLHLLATLASFGGAHSVVADPDSSSTRGLYPLISYQLPAGHPGWRRCSSLTYSRYARSSRLAIRAPRSGIWYLFSGYRPLGGVSRRESVIASARTLAVMCCDGSLVGRAGRHNPRRVLTSPVLDI